MVNVNRNSTLRQLDGIKSFYLGQLEGEYLRGMGNIFGCPERASEVIAASMKFDFNKKIANNYKVIEANKDDAVFIADYLCAINWLSHFYSEFDNNKDNPKYRQILKNFYLESEIDYFEEAADFYCFAYGYLNNRFYDDKNISDSVKSDVWNIND